MAIEAESKLEHEVVQELVKMGVQAGLESPVRRPILEAVDESVSDAQEEEEQETQEGPSSEADERHPVRTGLKVLLVVGLLLVVLYIGLSRLSENGE